jgi:dihydrofolate reductase
MVYWGTAEQQNPSLSDHELEFARIWRQLPKLVFSTTLERVEGNATLARDGVADAVARLTQQSGGDVAVGGARLAATCTELGLIDEYRLFVSPVVLGGGSPYFPALERRVGLELLEIRTFGGRVVYLRYGAHETPCTSDS